MAEETRLAKDCIRRLVLIVDDEQVNRRLLGRIIEKDYEVIYAENGQEALELIKKRAKTLSMILLDLIMPVMDGYELLGIIKDDPEYSRIPVIVLTSERTAEVKSLQLGAADFIPKPYDMPEVILARVRCSIELAEDSSMINATENDALTGLYTRKYFFQYARRHDRYYADADMDAVALNINRFRLVNELNGRLFGDTVISAISAQLDLILGETSGMACRNEGDSFYIYIGHRDDYDRLLARITDSIVETTGNKHICIRMGVYQNVDKEIDIETRFERAVFACNTLRGSHSSGIAVYDDNMFQREMYYGRMIEDMDSGIVKKQFRIYFQPEYDIRGESPVLIGAEALIRWEHTDYGMIYPGSFIPIFEENGLIRKLDSYVWKETAAQIKNWREKYGMSLPVSVNISRVDINDPELEDKLCAIVKENGLEPSDLPLEITESAYTDNPVQILKNVERIKNAGFKVYMDDFGSGFSSLNMLSALPIDGLKLDIDLIRNMTQGEKERGMVKLMIDIAGFMKMPVIAEGVETKEQYDLIKEAGCDMAQGFYFSEPVPAEEFGKLIEAGIG